MAGMTAPVPNHHDGPADLAARFESLHAEFQALKAGDGGRRRPARWKDIGIGAGAATLLCLVLGAAERAVPVLQTNRLEILGADGQLVAVLGADERGGRLDLWSAAGRNALRASVNDQGGDFNLWNTAGRSVLAAFTTAQGGELGVWNAFGQRQGVMSAGAEGGALSVFAADHPVVRVDAGRPEQAITVAAGEPGTAAVAIGRTPAGTGRVGIGDEAGRVVVRAEVQPGGMGSVSVHQPDGARVAAIAGLAEGGVLLLDRPGGVPAFAAGPVEGGAVMDLHNSQGERIARLGANAGGGGRLSLSAPGPVEGFAVECVDGAGTTLALLGPRGRRGLIAGARAEGGIVNLFNRQDIAVLVAGYAPDGLGGGAVVRNGRGLAVAEITAAGDETGVVRVSDADGERTRAVRPMP